MSAREKSPRDLSEWSVLRKKIIDITVISLDLVGVPKSNKYANARRTSGACLVKFVAGRGYVRDKGGRGEETFAWRAQSSSEISKRLHSRSHPGKMKPVSYTHLTLPTTPYV